MAMNPKIAETLIPPDEIASRIHEVCPPDKLRVIISQMYNTVMNNYNAKHGKHNEDVLQDKTA